GERKRDGEKPGHQGAGMSGAPPENSQEKHGGNSRREQPVGVEQIKEDGLLGIVQKHFGADDADDEQNDAGDAAESDSLRLRRVLAQVGEKKIQSEKGGAGIPRTGKMRHHRRNQRGHDEADEAGGQQVFYERGKEQIGAFQMGEKFG